MFTSLTIKNKLMANSIAKQLFFWIYQKRESLVIQWLFHAMEECEKWDPTILDWVGYRPPLKSMHTRNSQSGYTTLVHLALCLHSGSLCCVFIYGLSLYKVNSLRVLVCLLHAHYLPQFLHSPHQHHQAYNMSCIDSDNGNIGTRDKVSAPKKVRGQWGR